MEILGIGINELVFIVIIALIVLGPKDMQKAGRTIGRWLRNIVTSDGWKAFLKTSREIRTLPNRLMREANEEIKKIGGEIDASDPARTGYGSRDTRSSPKLTRPQPSESPVPPRESGSTPPRSGEDDSPADSQEPHA